ncbi:MAG: PEP/pyruvate-binding domain-containing protein [Candidatus Helarchaeota archaeon]
MSNLKFYDSQSIDLNIFNGKIPDKIINLKNAQKAGWKILRNLIVMIDLNIKINGLNHNFNLKTIIQRIRNKINQVFRINPPNTIYCLLIEPYDQEIQRAFIYCKLFDKEFGNFLKNLLNKKIFKNIQNSKYSKLIFLFTEVIRPKFSGNIQFNGNKGIIEVGYGQMFSKGMIIPSSYIILGKKVIKKEVLQTRQIIIKKDNKQIISCNKKPSLSTKEISNITKKSMQFQNLFSEKKYIIEWFITEKGELYFYDTMELKSQNEFVPDFGYILVKIDKYKTKNYKIDRLIYPGKASGLIKYINVNENNNKALDLHFNTIKNMKIKENNNENKPKFIICSEYPNIKLFKLVPNTSAFIFKEGAILSHLAIHLRNERIPAVISKDLYENVIKYIDNEEVFINLKINTNVKKNNINQKSIFNNSRFLNYEMDRKSNFQLRIYPKNINKLDLIGNKALGLNLLYNNGLTIPKTLVLIPQKFNLNNDKLIDIINEYFPEFLEKEISLICRSSSNMEDTVQNSSAGLFLSSEKIINIDNLIINLNKIIKHASNPEILSYKEKYYPNLEKIHLGIIIQEYIDSNLSGVIFTRPPLDIFRETVVLEISKISPNKVTSGIADKTIKIDHSDIETQNLFEKISNSFENLNLKQVNSLCNLIIESVKLEKKYSIPFDIEFAVERHSYKLFYLQIRPIEEVDYE